MTYTLDLENLEKAEPRAVKRTPKNTKPLEFTAAERKALANIQTECERLLKINGLSTTHQVRTMYAGVVASEAILSKEWNALAQTAVMGLRAIEETTGVSPYIFHHTDGANRNLPSPERIALKDLALRLHLAARSLTSDQEDAALCLRAVICAALAAERGLIHLAKENFGAVIRTLYRDESPLHHSIQWTAELEGYARRFANAKVKMP